MSKSPEELVWERRKRIQDAYDMKVPDRIPIQLNFGYMLARLGGITKQELHDNPDLEQELLEKWMLYYQPDTGSGILRASFEPSVILRGRLYKRPGYGLGPDEPFQFVEGEYMQPEEYDEFIEDPTNFVLRKFMPRVFEALQGFALMPNLVFMGIRANFAFLNAPPIKAAVEALFKVADWFAEMAAKSAEYGRRMEALGFPADASVTRGAMVLAPFDLIGDYLRGMRGVFLDMYRCPDKLLAAQEKIRRIMVETAIQSCQATGSRLVFIPLHRGSDEFLSLEQFETFYWPQLKAMMLDLIDAGLKPCPYYEGFWDRRLEYLRELPRGKTAGMFERSNMFKVKEVVGDVMTIIGGFPVTLLEGGTPEEVREHTKKMCEVCGKDGGFIMGASTVLDECDPELVKVWVDATKEYGVY